MYCINYLNRVDWLCWTKASFYKSFGLIARHEPLTVIGDGVELSSPTGDPLRVEDVLEGSIPSHVAATKG
jgi:hypothetical protein